MNPGFVSAVEMLPLPKLDTLSNEQVDGKACVWCSGRPRTPLALGIRLSANAGTLRRWCPVAHQRCAAHKAGKVYRLHIQMCARCAHRDYCPDGRALYKLAFTD
ncbi:hypothetical protein [Streptomyces sp. NPDC052015]|uniref:hypothetical protein n=1 Tax=Streptomyces sp. NPDC052015 TaxID=3154755 RepID=UPI003421B277